MAAGCVIENTISLINRSELDDLTRPGHFLCQKLREGCPINYAKFQRDPPSGSAAISDKLWRWHPPPPCTGEGYGGI